MDEEIGMKETGKVGTPHAGHFMTEGNPFFGTGGTVNEQLWRAAA